MRTFLLRPFITRVSLFEAIFIPCLLPLALILSGLATHRALFPMLVIASLAGSILAPISALAWWLDRRPSRP